MNDTMVPALRATDGVRRDDALPIAAHLADLRRSVIVALLAAALCGAVAYGFADPVIRSVVKPVGKLYFMSPAEAFMTKLKVAAFAGGLLASPVIFYEAWNFVRRGLFPGERKAVVLLTAVSLALFFAGAAFCYALVLPAGIAFLMSYGSEVLVPFISVTRYLSFVGRMVLSFGLAFELPLAMWFLVRAGIVRSAALSANRRLAAVLVFLAAAVLTPTTDIFNQVLLAGPLLLLYEAGILAARCSERGRRDGKNRVA